MAGTRGTEKRALSGQVLVRLPSTTAARIVALAAAEGLTAAAWARRHLVVAAGTEAVEAVPIPARRAPRPPPPEVVVQIAALREYVAELSGAMVKAAIMARVERADVLHAEIESLLPTVRTAVRDLDTLKRAMLEAPQGAR